jgi:hypothetical protein
MAGDATVEWGDNRPVRLMDRLFGDVGGGGPRLSAPAVGAAVVATALFAAAELLPWMTVQAIVISDLQPGSALETRDMPLDRVGAGVAVAYYVGLFLLLSVTGLAQVSRPHARRALTAAGFGLGAGMLVLLLGIVRRAGSGAGSGLDGVYSVATATVGGAPYLAIAGVLMAAAALVLSGWHPSVAGRRRPAATPDEADDDDDDGEEPGPIDLTVTPA